MLPATITSIRMLAAADPEADDATVERIVAACKAPPPRRNLIDVKEACAILGGKNPISRMTLYKWTKRGILHPIRYSTRNIRYDRNEIETIAQNGVV